MLTGAQLATAISAVLVAAITLGWILHWIWTRLASAGGDAARLAEMVDRLHEAERAREAAEDARRLAETLLAAREAEMERSLAEMRARLDGMVDDRDAKTGRIVREARADAEACKSGLRGARRRIAELEAEIEAMRRRAGA
jgi:chromosome segregation ATPase